MSRPDVTVIIPVFNRPRLVIEAIDSTLAQTSPDLEVVVCDNASTDSTWERIQERARDTPRLRPWRAVENMGPLENWRRGAAMARGRLAALLFSDDRWQPRFLERAAPALEDPEVGFVFSTVSVERAEGPPLLLYDQFPAGKRPMAEFVARHLGLENGRHVPSSPGCALFRTKDLVDGLEATWPDPHGIGFARHGAGPDLWVYLAAATRYPALVHLAEPLVVFRDHRDTLTRSPGVSLGYAAARQRFVDQVGVMGLTPGEWSVAQMSRIGHLDDGAASAALMSMIRPRPSAWARWTLGVRRPASAWWSRRRHGGRRPSPGGGDPAGS